MDEKIEMPKAYEAGLYETGLYERWEKSGYFNPDNLPGKRTEPFCIVLPPPNRTGTLHLGHATVAAISDIMIRFERMRGKRALWIPGTDHAAIATQVKVEQLLIKEGMKDPRKELGREKFLEKVRAFADASALRINEQMRKMGSSLDWTREAYTLDAPRNIAVNEMFKMMYEDGVIERGYRVVNWDPQFQTTLSDDEVETKEVNARLITFKYDAAFPIAISTTRPETKFGDTAVAVHPEDERYKKFVGQTFEPIFCGKKIKVQIIADAAVDPVFGTGALGVTPAHSIVDAEIAERHVLPTVIVIGRDGKMLPEAGAEFAGLTVVDARKKVEKTLEAAGLLIKVEDTAQNLPVAQRGGAAVEQIPMRQWFVRVNKPFTLRQATLGKWKKGDKARLKELMIETVTSGQTKITPERFEKIYFNWVNNLRDWCISRQIWFGHQIPVWYRNSEGGVAGNHDDVHIGAESPGDGWDRDPDTLDTWFSSGMWTFSTLGWPENTSDLKTYHPTAVLETAYDILTFWVTKMIMMTNYALGVVPFKDVYLHGLVRDEQGRKMSKSLGNVIDPLDVSAKYGTDAVRLSLVIGTSPGQDTRMSEEKIAGFRNFTNKLWNIGRFVSRAGEEKKKLSIADKWILSRLDNIIEEVTKNLGEFNFSRAGEMLRDFTWNEFADWYVEIHKREGNDAVLREVFMELLKLWHPFMPYVTEVLWSELGGKDLLMIAEWPKPQKRADEKAEKIMSGLQEVVSAIRSIRSDYKVAPDKLVDAVIEASTFAKEFAGFEPVIKTLGRVNDLKIANKVARPEQAATVTVGLNTVSVPLAGLVDTEKEKKRIVSAIEETKKMIGQIEGRLNNPEFVGKAPEKVVAGEKAKLAEFQEKIVKLNEQFAALG